VVRGVLNNSDGGKGGFLPMEGRRGKTFASGEERIGMCGKGEGPVRGGEGETECRDVVGVLEVYHDHVLHEKEIYVRGWGDSAVKGFTRT
jgi:hypothetical protein